MTEKIDVAGEKRHAVGYAGFGGMIAVYEKGQEPDTAPPGTIYVQEATTVTNAVVDGKPAKGYLVVEGPRKFLRGRLVVDPKEVEAILAPKPPKGLEDALAGLGISFQVEMIGSLPERIVVIEADGTDRAISLNDGDVAPPESASPYPVGEAPDELEAARLAQIRQDIEDGVYGDPGDEDDFDDGDLDKEDEDKDQYGLTPSDYAAGATVGVCPACLRTHGLRPGVVGLTEEEAVAARQQREAAYAGSQN